jgi:membrane protein YqaA with SNARE-associated domain
LWVVAELAILFALVFALNVIPAFAPPTWMALAWIGFSHPLGNPFLVALIGALAATSGRLVLAKLSRVIIRQRFMSDAMRGNIDVIKEGLERHRTLTFSAFLLYAFGPFPSNYLFIAYGLTSLPLWLVAIPFFIGRCASYSFFVFTASEMSQRFAHEATEAQPALAWRHAYPHLENATAIGQQFDAVDAIAAALGRQPHGERDAADNRRPWPRATQVRKRSGRCTE